jgi:hypothetical protein
MEALASEACDKMLPTLNDGLSMVNFAIELKDLKHWSKVGDALARIRGRVKKLTKYGVKTIDPKSLPYNDLSYKMPDGRVKMLKDIVRRLTGAHLEASFGIVPFVSDLVETYTALNSIDYKVKQLKKYANTPQHRHYRKVLHTPDDKATTGDWRAVLTQPTSWFTPQDGQGRRTPFLLGRTRWVQRPVYTATVRYSYTLQKMGEAEEYIKTRFDSLGVRLDPGILWDAIPYSFMVDWVVDVSGFLHSFARNNFPIDITIHEFCHSLAYSSESMTSIWSPGKPRSGFFPPPTWCNDYQVENIGLWDCHRMARVYYKRNRFDPNTHALRTKRPGLRQAALTGSLLVNKALGGKMRHRR